MTDEAVVLWDSEPASKGRPVDFSRYLPPWYELERLATLDKLPRGPARVLFNVALDLMEENAAGPWTEATAAELRAVAGMTDEAFAAAWPAARARFVWRAGRMVWPPLERAHAAALKTYEKQNMRNRLGGNCLALRILVEHEPGKDADDGERKSWLKRVGRTRRRVIFCQEQLLELGGRIASRPWLLGAAATKRVLLDLSEARRGAFRRLLKVADALGLDRKEVKRIWAERPRMAHDLTMRHRLNVLSFNGLRLALVGLGKPWAWSDDWTRPGGLADLVVGL